MGAKTAHPKPYSKHRNSAELGPRITKYIFLFGANSEFVQIAFPDSRKGKITRLSRNEAIEFLRFSGDPLPDELKGFHEVATLRPVGVSIEGVDDQNDSVSSLVRPPGFGEHRDEARAYAATEAKAATHPAPINADAGESKKTITQLKAERGEWMLDNCDPFKLTNKQLQAEVNAESPNYGWPLFDSDTGNGAFDAYKTAYFNRHEKTVSTR